MHAFVHNILVWYFDVIGRHGLLSVVGLMAMESSIFPVPSELVVPPAAYLMAHDQPNGLWLAALVILAGTVGSYLGSAITYGVSRVVGRPIVVRYGKYFLIPESKLELAERWVETYGAGGIFFARLLPVVRHLISIPAGLVGMDFKLFSAMTIAGSALWCTVLTVFGLVMATSMTAVLEGKFDSPEYLHAFHQLTLAVVVMVAVLGVLYVKVVHRHDSPETPTGDEPAAS